MSSCKIAMPWKLKPHEPKTRGQPKRPFDDRPSAAKRGYGRRWRRFRRWFLGKYPLCSDIYGVHATENRVVIATQVDHIKLVEDYPELQYVEANCRSLCASCHSRRTREYHR